MSCGYSINIKEIVDEIMKVLPKGEDDYVESGEVINGGKTLRLTRKKGGTIDIALPTPPTVDDIYINKAEIVANGPNKDLVLTNNKGEKLSVTLPTASAPAPAEDKYVTDFSLANRGGKPVLELRRSDNVTLTASLPENSGGGSGTDDYVTAGALTVQREKGGAEGRKTFYANLKLTRKGGGEVDVDMSKLISTAQDNPEFTPRMDINNELSRVVKADGYYVTAPETVRWAKDDSSHAAVVDLPAPALWFDASGAGTQVAPGRKLLPIMDLHWGKPYGNDKMGLTQDALCYTRADGTQSWIVIPQTGGGGAGGGGTDRHLAGVNTLVEAAPSATDSTRELRTTKLQFVMNDGSTFNTNVINEAYYSKASDTQIVFDGRPRGFISVVPETEDTKGQKRIALTEDNGGTLTYSSPICVLPEEWFEKRGKEETSKFVTIEEYNKLASNLAQISWSSAIPHESFVMPQSLLDNFVSDLLLISSNQDGASVSYRVTDRSAWVKKYGNNVEAYPYQIISLFQPGDTKGYNSTHLHTPHPFLHALVPSRDPPPGAKPNATRNGTHAIDIFRQRYGEGFQSLQYAYAGTLYMSTSFKGDPQNELPPGVYSALFPIGMVNTPPSYTAANYASQLPEMLYYRVRRCFEEETPDTISSELIFNEKFQTEWHTIQPHF